jgi:nitrite reductase/ring-hydroxylating ferredoxin subunit
VTSAGEDEVTRREFVRYLVLASCGFAAGNVSVAAWSSARSVKRAEARPLVALDRVPEGSAHLFRYPTDADPAILVHLPGGELRAYSQKCTHLGCVVYWEPHSGELECPCHEGFFDPGTGEALRGPPQRAPRRIQVAVRDGTVWAVADLGEGHA